MNIKRVTIKNFAILCAAASLAVILGAAVFSTRGGAAQWRSYTIGSRGPAGGWVFYDKGDYKGGWRYLEAAPVSQGYAEWGCTKKPIYEVNSRMGGTKINASFIGHGKKNTRIIMSKCLQRNIAARKAASYRGGGKSDWFLPSSDELEMMYENLSPLVPGFNDHIHWSSTQRHGAAWFVNFHDGLKETCRKNFLFNVRAARSF